MVFTLYLHMSIYVFNLQHSGALNLQQLTYTTINGALKLTHIEWSNRSSKFLESSDMYTNLLIRWIRLNSSF